MRLLFPALLFLTPILQLQAEKQVVDSAFHHLRNAEPREWTHYPDTVEAEKLQLQFDAGNPESWKLLTLRQKGTKQTWTVTLNGEKIGQLQRDHNHLEHGITIPGGLLKAEDNVLEIATTSKNPDDIEVGDIVLHDLVFPLADEARMDQLAKNRGFRRGVPGDLSARLELVCLDENSGEPIPCRFTIVDAETGVLAFLGAESNDRLAVREGVIYSIDGKAEAAVEKGRNYKIYCGRGFEYSLGEKTVTLASGAKLVFKLRREVQTPGLVACDTHLHTYEFDRHGDCTLTERIISAAGEGVELPIATGHDKHIDYAPEAKRIGADRWLTTVLGCEVTTNLGHFNSFPIQPGAEPAQHKLRDWTQIFQNIYATPDVKVCILNHGRDVHRNFTPLAPENFNLKTGTFLNGRKLRANGIEIINSGAQQTDPLQLVGDWFALLKSGHKIAAVGSSDSHTVNFAIPGQGRTYVKATDGDPGKIDVSEAVDSFLNGQTWVSFGLLTDLSLDQKAGGVTVRVTGPSWANADRVRIFRNGELVRQERGFPRTRSKPGVIFEQTFALSDWDAKPGDFLCAVATGPGILEPWWPMMPPYQPDSPDFEPFVFGMSPAVWVK
ncbi:MAG: CehA/McbA family metallohydrolase [Verrucomicrobiales bacterium]|nr:CehA/McbA family metallohydrolase [Verrucomicrobiales bacterium]